MTQLTSNPALADRPASGIATRLGDLSQLTKPRITLMVVLTAFIGYAVAARQISPLATVGDVITTSGASLWWTLIAVAFSCMGATTLNQVIERRVDAKMHRTRNRPLPARRMSAATAAVIGAVLAVTGVALLAWSANALAAALSTFTIGSYVLIYTPMKRRTHLATIVGAAPGAMPPVMGYAAAYGGIAAPAVIMFAILFLWQLPHFLTIAWLYREDYARGGLPVLPVTDPTGRSTFRQMLLGCVVLLPLGLMPTIAGFAGRLYFHGALLAGMMFLLAGAAVALQPSRGRTRAAFFASLIYLPAVFILMLIDQTPGPGS